MGAALAIAPLKTPNPDQRCKSHGPLILHPGPFFLLALCFCPPAFFRYWTGANPVFYGALFEGFIAAEIVKAQVNAGRRRELCYFRDEQGLEVDFLGPGRSGARRVQDLAHRHARHGGPDATTGGGVAPETSDRHDGRVAPRASSAENPGRHLRRRPRRAGLGLAGFHAPAWKRENP